MGSQPAHLLVRNIGTLVTCDAEVGRGPLGLLERAAVLCEGDRVSYVGPEEYLPSVSGEEPITIDMGGQLVTPGLVDAHTHSLYGGDRLDDFEARLGGDSYVDIGKRGGGILSTVAATTAASVETLVDLLDTRCQEASAQGVTTIEVKSGYGLEMAAELRMLEVINEADRRTTAELVPTFLGAHVLPVAARRSNEARAEHVRHIVEDMLPAVVEGRLARFCDVFIDQGAYTADEGRLILEAARELGLGLKVHAEQLTQTGAAALAAELGATSAEHLERTSDEALRAMAEAGTVAVLLPGASLFLREPFTDANRFRDAGVAMAVATDRNPGSSPTNSLLFAAQLAVLGCGMTIPEALRGITTHAARALGLHRDRGMVRPGMRADLAMFRCHDPRELIYELGASLCTGVVKDGLFHRVEMARITAVRS